MDRPPPLDWHGDARFARSPNPPGELAGPNLISTALSVLKSRVFSLCAPSTEDTDSPGSLTGGLPPTGFDALADGVVVAAEPRNEFVVDHQQEGLVID